MEKAQVLLLLAGLFSVSHGGPVACGHNPDYAELVPGVRLEPATPRLGKRQAAQPIRIEPYYDTTALGLTQQIKDTIQMEIIPEIMIFLEQTLSVKTDSVVASILLERNCTTNAVFYPIDGIGPRKCAAQCTATTMCGTVAVPEQHLKQCFECNDGGSGSCGPDPSTQDGVGVSDKDYILYVSAIQEECPEGTGGSTTLAFAGSCQMESTLDRPIAGYVNFCPDGIGSEPDNNDLFMVTKHEVLHAIAFSSSLFPFWRYPNGTERTGRDSNGFPPVVEGRFMWDDDTIRSVTYTEWETRNGFVSHDVNIMVTERVVEEGRAYFNCSSLEGVEIEDQGGEGTALSHWEKRILGNEAMTGVFTFNPGFSRITLAALEDSGWYEVNYALANDLLWGRNAGCELPSGSCGGYIKSQQDSGEPITPFCARLNDGSNRLGCTVDREAVALCNLALYTSDLPLEYQYFEDGPNFNSGIAPRVGGSLSVADFCPFQDVFSFVDSEGNVVRRTECSVASNSPANNNLAETYGTGSRCVEHGRQWMVNGGPINTYGSGCYQYECSSSGVTIFLLGTPFSCSTEGEELIVDFEASGSRYQGSIICPPLAQICHNVTQPTVSPGPMPTASPTGSTSMPTGPNGGTTVNTPMSSVSHLLPNVALIVVALYCTTMACTLDRVC